jgi:predicted nuclease of predicted toxin-antitoxin system
MRLLLDMNMPRRIAGNLRASGHDALHIGEISLGRLPDDDVFAHARGETRVVETFDLDFGEIVGATRGGGPGVVLLRLRSARAAHIMARMEAALVQAGSALNAGALVLVEDGRIRIRMPPA